VQNSISNSTNIGRSDEVQQLQSSSRCKKVHGIDGDVEWLMGTAIYNNQSAKGAKERT
jgi:hypothetical protein